MKAFRPAEYGRIYGVVIKRRRKRKEKFQNLILMSEELKTAIGSRVLYLKEGVDTDCVVYAEQRARIFRGRFSVTKDFENDESIVGLCVNALKRVGKDAVGRTKKQVNYRFIIKKKIFLLNPVLSIVCLKGLLRNTAK